MIRMRDLGALRNKKMHLCQGNKGTKVKFRGKREQGQYQVNSDHKENFYYRFWRTEQAHLFEGN